MERLQSSERQPELREITGEIMYLDEMRRLNQPPKPYTDLPEMARELYETEADMCREAGVQPAIINEYERVDREHYSPTAERCVEFAEALLQLRDKHTRLTFVDIVAHEPAQNSIDKLRRTNVGTLLAREDEQLALDSDGSYYPQLDITKQNLMPRGVSVRAWGWTSSPKTVFTHRIEEPYEHPRDCLYYPSDELAKWYELDLNFSYASSSAGIVNETISLSIGQNNDLRFSRQIWFMAYAETGYEGHAGKRLNEVTTEDVLAFLNVIAETVGDTPISVREYGEQRFLAYLQKVILPESIAYINEWVENSWSGQVEYELSHTRLDSVSLAAALTMPEHVAAAHTTLVELVNAHRQERNKLSLGSDTESSGDTVQIWRDSIAR